LLTECDRGCLAPCDLTAGRGCYKSRYEKQKKFYSKKQKNHTFKNQFIVTPNGQGRVDVVVGKPGPTSDLNTWRSSKKKNPFFINLNEIKVMSEQPLLTQEKKKPRRGELNFR
jgi:hypothetical protein